VGKPREFTTLPVRAIADTRLTALELRCLAVIALHDGMSLVRKTGPGCYARSATLAELARTDISNFSKATSRLLKFGYLVREKQQNDARRFTLRVTYGEDDSWRVDQPSAANPALGIVGEPTNDSPEIVGDAANICPEIVGDGESENGSFPPLPGPQYISLNEELDFVETNEINSVETAHFAVREMRGGEFSHDDFSVSGISPRPQAKQAVRKASIAERLGQSWAKLEPLAQLVRFERELRAVGGLDSLNRQERLMWERWLFEAADKHLGQPASFHANRLLDELAGGSLADCLSADELRTYLRDTLKALGHGGQQRIADAAEVPYGKLHAFHHGGRLAEEFLPAVQAACSAYLPLPQWRAAA